MEKTKRLLSLDALRGFDMFFIMGGETLFVALSVLFPGAFFGVLAQQMHHVAWNGFACYDLVFPLFLFIAGISFPFSLAKQRERGLAAPTIYKHIIRRGVVLVLLGFVYNGLLQFDFEHMRYASVLGRIGLAWMFAALIFINTRTITRVVIALAILVGYWLLLAFVPAPDGMGEGVYTIKGSLVGYVDRMWLPGRLHGGIHDPEGLLSTLPAIVTAMLGMFAGELMKSDKTPVRKLVLLAGGGIVLVLVGLLWDLCFPINKNLWTSSFVCFVGGLSALLFALFYYVIDILECRSWTKFFTVIGVNSITIYLAQEIVGFGRISEFFLGGVIRLSPESARPFLQAAGYIAVCWLFLWFLNRRKIFLRV